MLKKDDGICSSEVEAQPTHVSCEQEEINGGVNVEAVEESLY